MQTTVTPYFNNKQNNSLFFLFLSKYSQIEVVLIILYAIFTVYGPSALAGNSVSAQSDGSGVSQVARYYG